VHQNWASCNWWHDRTMEAGSRDRHRLTISDGRVVPVGSFLTRTRSGAQHVWRATERFVPRCATKTAPPVLYALLGEYVGEFPCWGLQAPATRAPLSYVPNSLL